LKGVEEEGKNPRSRNASFKGAKPTRCEEKGKTSHGRDVRYLQEEIGPCDEEWFMREEEWSLNPGGGKKRREKKVLESLEKKGKFLYLGENIGRRKKKKRTGGI